MLTGKSSHPGSGPGRYAFVSDHDEEDDINNNPPTMGSRRDAFPMASHPDAWFMQEDMQDILDQEPRVLELLGADLLNSILTAGQDTFAPRTPRFGHSTAHSTASAAGAGLSFGGTTNTTTESMFPRGRSSFIGRMFPCSRSSSIGTAPTAQSNYGSSPTLTPELSTGSQAAGNDGRSNNTNNAARFTPGLNAEARKFGPTYQGQTAASPVLAGPSRVSTFSARNPPTKHSQSYYEGQIDNFSAEIPANQSTLLFILNLPADTTISDILNSIRATGKIWSLTIVPPTPPHAGCAAKICFFTREAAETFYRNTRTGFSIGRFLHGQDAIVMWNRERFAEHVGEPWDRASRVLIVRGPREIVNMAAILAVVSRKLFRYNLVKVSETDYAEGGKEFVEVEMHFGSFRAQAQSAYIVLKLEMVSRRNGVTISYGADPCA